MKPSGFRESQLCMPHYFVNNNKHKKWPHLGSPLCHFYAMYHQRMDMVGWRYLQIKNGSFFRLMIRSIICIFMATLNALEEVHC